jgi:putative copper export protein
VQFLTRFALYSCVITMIGSIVFSIFVVPRGVSDPQRNYTLRSRAARAGFIASLLLLPVAAARLYFQLDSMRFAGEPLFQSFGVLMSHTLWGQAWVLQCAGAAVAALAFRLAGASRFRSLGVQSAAWICALVVITLPLSGHAVAVEPLRGLAVAADALHVAGAAAWLGTLALIASFVLAPASVRGVVVGMTAAEKLNVIRAFSPLALTSAGLVAASGAIASLLHIGQLGNLTATAYGRTLLLKLLCVSAVLYAGYVNWKKNTPRIPGDDGASVRRGVARELGAAILVLLLTTALVVTPPPVAE